MSQRRRLIPTTLELNTVIEWCAREIGAQRVQSVDGSHALQQWRLQHGLMLTVMPLNWHWHSWSVRMRVTGPVGTVFSDVELAEEKPVSLRNMKGRMEFMLHAQLQENIWAGQQHVAAWPLPPARLFRPLYESPDALVNWRQDGERWKLTLGSLSDLLLAAHLPVHGPSGAASSAAALRRKPLTLLTLISGLPPIICRAMELFDGHDRAPGIWDGIGALSSLGRQLHLWASAGRNSQDGALAEPIDLVHTITGHLLLAAELERERQ